MMKTVIASDSWWERTVLALLLASAMLSGCSSLAPVNLPVQSAAPPADTPLWRSVADLREDNWNILLNEGDDAVDWRLTAIDSASQSIDLQTFLWSLDQVGAAVMSHLLTAADRGVAVRLLIDDSFLFGEDDLLLALAEHPNVEYRVFNPYARRSNGFFNREILNLGEFDRLNHRMHNKVMLVDNRVAVVGGRNLADEYFGFHSEANFRDMELLVGGPIVPELSSVFDRYWNDQWSFPIEMLAEHSASYQFIDRDVLARTEDDLPHRELDEEALMRRWSRAVGVALSGDTRLLVDNPPGKNPDDRAKAPVQVAKELIRVFDSAVDEVIVISAYLIPSPQLEAVVRKAVERGVLVRILTNSIRSNNHITAHSAYRNHIDELLGDGANLHEVRVDARDRSRYMLAPTDNKALALHAKVLVIDQDRVFIGSANLDPRSMRINTEVGLLVHSKALNTRVRESVEPDLLQANAWSLQLDASGDVVWVAEDQVLSEQPAASYMQRIEDWFFAHMRIENQM